MDRITHAQQMLALEMIASSAEHLRKQDGNLGSVEHKRTVETLRVWAKAYLDTQD